MVSTVDKNNKFSFEPITADDISKQIKRLDINKATQKNVSFELMFAKRSM